MAQSELEMANSSSDEEEEVSSEGSESESESEMTPPPPPSSKITQATPQSSSEESESDADSPPKRSEKADPNIKPLASKPMDDEPSRKPRPKNTTSRYSPPSVKPLNGKRKAAEIDDEAVESKIQKEAVTVAVPGPENAGEKKPLFQRLWSEDDEIELIKGMIGYVAEKGKDPISDVSDFHEFVKSSLNVDVNNGQMAAKVKRLKAKFMNNVGKIEQNGKVRSLSNPHEKKMYELSEKLWGKIRNSNKNPAIVSCSTKKANPKPKADQKHKGNSNIVVSSEANVNGGLESGEDVVPSMGGIRFPITEEGIMNRALELASGAKKSELEAKWNDLKMQEFKHYLKKLEVMKEQGELVLNAIQKSGAS